MTMVRTEVTANSNVVLTADIKMNVLEKLKQKEVTQVSDVSQRYKTG